jgi:hypothetical protein
MTLSAGFTKALRFAQDMRDAGSTDAEAHILPTSGHFVASGSLNGAAFEIYFDSSSFRYGNSRFTPLAGKPRKVRNVREALRLLDSLGTPMTRSEFAAKAKYFDVSTDNNTLGHEVRRFRTQFGFQAEEGKCDICASSGYRTKSTQVIACVQPQYNTDSKGTTYKGYNWVRFEAACDRCAEKHCSPLPS